MKARTQGGDPSPGEGHARGQGEAWDVQSLMGSGAGQGGWLSCGPPVTHLQTHAAMGLPLPSGHSLDPVSLGHSW